MPEGGDVGFYSNWRDGRAGRTFTCDELRADPRRRYGAGARRAIAGLSMGGLGAMDYAARRPRMFRAAASFSGVAASRSTSRGGRSGCSRATRRTRATSGATRHRRSATWRRHDPTVLPALSGTRCSSRPATASARQRDAIEAEVRARVARVRRPRAGAPRPGPRRPLRPRRPRLAVLAARGRVPLLLGPSAEVDRTTRRAPAPLAAQAAPPEREVGDARPCGVHAASCARRPAARVRHRRPHAGRPRTAPRRPAGRRGGSALRRPARHPSPRHLSH